jgi:predicted DNA-binding antitoxin AbrB/MazE fold protein
MTAIQAVYDGRVFIPEKPCNITKGSEVFLTIENKSFSEKEKKISAFKQLTMNIHETNKTDPLPPEFDVIMSQRLRFREIDNL